MGRRGGGALGAAPSAWPRSKPGRETSHPTSRRGRARLTRPPGVAGLFYPAQPDVLAALVERLVAHGRPEGPPPAALVVPHAGYEYSGPVAGVAYARVAARRSVVTRVVALGPAHRVWLRGS